MSMYMFVTFKICNGFIIYLSISLDKAEFLMKNAAVNYYVKYLCLVSYSLLHKNHLYKVHRAFLRKIMVFITLHSNYIVMLN